MCIAVWVGCPARPGYCAAFPWLDHPSRLLDADTLRNVPSEFNEGRYAAFSLGNTAQVRCTSRLAHTVPAHGAARAHEAPHVARVQTCILALMLMSLIRNEPYIMLMAQWAAIYWGTTVMLLLMFVPKMHNVHWLREGDGDLKAASDMLKQARMTTHKRSSWSAVIKSAKVALQGKRGTVQPRSSMDEANLLTFRGSGWDGSRRGSDMPSPSPRKGKSAAAPSSDDQGQGAAAPSSDDQGQGAAAPSSDDQGQGACSLSLATNACGPQVQFGLGGVGATGSGAAAGETEMQGKGDEDHTSVESRARCESTRL